MIKVNAKNQRNNQTLRILGNALRKLTLIINKKDSSKVIPQRPRKLTKQERYKLRLILLRLKDQYMTLAASPVKLDVAVTNICTSPSMVSRLRSAGIETLEEMWEFTPAVLAGMIEEHEVPGGRTQYHMYLFVRPHNVKMQ